MRMKQVIIFDVDGTLVDTNWMHAESWSKTFKKFGVTVAKEQILPLIGTGGEKITKKFFNPEDVKKYADAAIKYHSENIAGLAENAGVFPKVRELFQELKKRRKTIILATSARSVIVGVHVENMGVGDLVDGIVSSSDVRLTKPDPDLFIAALRKANAEAVDAVVVGDTVWDVIAANKAQLRTVAVLTGGNSEEALREAGATEVYKDIADLWSHLDSSMLR